ncbi:MAG: hypothetical protein KGM24_05820, partial [Elusimicrobia bacterium]|nr:hypothetical protein [Elusimicrobiota bacterium]
MRRALILAAALAAARPAFAGPARWDVCYLRRVPRANAAAYARKLASLLGPRVAARLRVVRERGSWGVVYRMRGGRDAAFALSRRHTLLLTRRELEAAVIVEDRPWETLPVEGAPAGRAPL